MKRLSIIIGHYGSGKTCVAVNLALRAKRLFPQNEVRIADIDIVNPYFRTADSRELLEKHGVTALIPEFANTNVDIPSLPPQILSLFTEFSDGVISSESGCANESISIIDVGGDDGAAALGMYSGMINKLDYDMFFIVNMYRPLICNPHDACECMKEIEEMSRLRCTGIINNSSLGEETTEEDILASIKYAEDCAKACSLPLIAHTFVPDYAPKTVELFPKEKKHLLMPIMDTTKKLF